VDDSFPIHGGIVIIFGCIDTQFFCSSSRLSWLRRGFEEEFQVRGGGVEDMEQDVEVSGLHATSVGTPLGTFLEFFLTSFKQRPIIAVQRIRYLFFR
jgi:hypothetical protein